ncbi:MAG: PRTRC system protein C [Anaerolineae bacterium]|nr:PRTRC system protein C [Anaerolineae bacterium]
MSRVFKYKELDFADPGEHFTNEEILAILSKTFPELVGGKIATTTSADGTATVTFEPKPKRNGADVPPLKIAVLAHREAKAREAAKAAEAERLAKAAEEAEKMTLELAIRPKLIAYFIDRAGVKLEERQLRIDFCSVGLKSYQIVKNAVRLAIGDAAFRDDVELVFNHYIDPAVAFQRNRPDVLLENVNGRPVSSVDYPWAVGISDAGHVRWRGFDDLLDAASYAYGEDYGKKEAADDPHSGRHLPR